MFFFHNEEIVVGNEINFNIILEEDVEALDEVVVVGYGNQKKLSVIGSVQTIEPTKLQVGSSRSLSNNLAGQLAGVIAVQPSGEPGYDNSNFWIRGIASFSGNTSPLVLVDGVERSLNDLDPAEIESFSVLKDASAGILYNRNFITPDEAGSWHCLWNPRNKGKILMKDSYRDAYGTAIIYAHARQLADSTVTVEQLMNDNSPEAIALAEKYLKAMKPNIAGWEADFGKEMMTKNKTWLNLTWSGDAVWAIEEARAVGVDLAYEVPREGSNIWYDGWVIPKYAGNPKAAAYFINYLCRPDIALRNMDAIGYVSAVATPEIMEAKRDTAIAMRSDLSYFFGEGVGADSLQINPVQYPDRKVVERCAMIRDFGNRTELVLEMWSRVKGDNLNTGIVLLIFSVFGVLFVWLVYGKIRKYRQKQRRHRRRRRR